MKKLTDAEIIKALEHCNSLKCLGCPCIQEQASCLDVLTTNVLEFIERKDAEIERLNKRIKRQKHALFEQQAYTTKLQEEIERLNNELVSADEVIGFRKAEVERLKEAYLVYEETTGLKQAKSEAYKEFAEKWNIELAKCRNKLVEQPHLAQCAFQIAIATTNDLLKELTEGNDG